MKKVIALAVAIIMILTFAGCANKNVGGTDDYNSRHSGDLVTNTESSSGVSSNASSSNKVNEDMARTLVEGKGDTWTLANTYKKLSEEKELTIVYLGGSVTVGTGSTAGNSWREKTTEWFKQTYRDATINEVNSAVGGTGSTYGYQRLKKDVLKKDPDLVFIEFAMNDVYENVTKTKAAANIDAIIRKINAYNPEIDIVMVFITSEGNVNQDYSVKQGHRHVAEYYGVPYIDVGNAMRDEIKKTGNEWSYYFGDVVHPNDIGYKVYFDDIQKNLKNWLDSAKTAIPKPHVLNKTPSVTYPYGVQ